MPRAESQQHNSLLPVEGVVVVLLHSGLYGGCFDDGVLLLVLETSRNV